MTQKKVAALGAHALLAKADCETCLLRGYGKDASKYS
jgi:hypothetical protein